jgi:hypothetical protein
MPVTRHCAVFRFFVESTGLTSISTGAQHWLYQAVNRRDSGTHPCGILDESPMEISRWS